MSTELLTNISVKKTTNSRLSEVDFNSLEFGKYTADHMLVCDYSHGEWQEPSIVPFGNLSLRPDTLALHYGQTVFEGMKAFRMKDNRINIFRLDKHFDRFNRSLYRMCMPDIPEDIFKEGLKQLIQTDSEWVPKQEGSSLYIRPFMYASEAKLGVKPADEYRFIIFSSPVQSVFAKPIKLKIETEYIRAARGGTGFAKCGGNYGASFFPTQEAKKQGYDQVLWTGGKNNRFIEESGMMNAMFVIDNKLVTPPLSDSILDGVTRDSLMTIAEQEGIATDERPVSIDELKTAFIDDRITEAFGAGTAAVVVPIERIGIEGTDYLLPPYSSQSVHNILKDKLNRIRTGINDDVYKWNTII
ncbi:MAG: branched-chain amino acid aminotransferase [Chitinophagaceae bacterium]